MVLVDLPDSDSTDPKHRVVADAVLPLADVLVWVTDPQKYADPGLLERFVPAALENPGRVNLVVLNQIDTLSRDDAVAVLAALCSLLEGEGLANLQVLATSAVTGDGIDELRGVLFSTQGKTTAAVRWLADEVASQAARLVHMAQLDEPETDSGIEEASGGTRSGEAGFGGVDQVEAAVAEAIAHLEKVAVDGATESGFSLMSEPKNELTQMVVAQFVDQVAGILPGKWAKAVAQALASPANLATRLDQALADVTLPPRPSWFSRTFQKAKSGQAWRAALRRVAQGAIGPVVERALRDPAQLVLADQRALAGSLDQVRQITQDLLA